LRTRCGGDQFDALASLPVDLCFPAQNPSRRTDREVDFARGKNRDFAGRLSAREKISE
jgi:hypothetical protein